MDAPEEVVAELKRGRNFELGYVAALGVNAGEDVADGAVLTGGVHALEDDEKGFGLAGVEDVLKFGELVAVFDQDGFGGLFGLEVAGVGGGYLGEPNLGVRLDEIRRLN